MTFVHTEEEITSMMESCECGRDDAIAILDAWTAEENKNRMGLRWVSDEVGYVDEDEEYY